jgi:hypothetical protein
MAADRGRHFGGDHRRCAPGSNEPVALIGHLQVAQQNWGRVSDPNSPFERLT